MTIDELAKNLEIMSREEQKQFERDIRLLWARDSLEDIKYCEIIKMALKSNKTHAEGF